MKRRYAGRIGKALLFGILLIFCFPASAAAQVQNYYVASTGSDSNDGSQARPWATINHADAALLLGPSGTIVHVAAGTYAGAISTNQNGTASAHIRYISDTQWAAKLTGDNTGNPLWSSHGPFTDIVNFEADASGKPGLVNGIVAYTGDTLIQGIKIHDLASGCNSFNTAVLESAAAHSPGHGNDFEANLVYHNNCGGNGSTPKPANNTGISLHSDDIARNNIVLDQGGYCMQVAHTSTRNIVTNNTLANCGYGGIIVGYTTNGPVTDTTISNNIVVNSGFAGGDSNIRVHGSGCGTNTIFRNNLVYGGSPSDYVFDGGCTNIATGTQSGSNAATFVNYTGTVSGDYHLKAGSSSINAGSTNCSSGVISPCIPTKDFGQNARPTPPSIGAHEYAVAGSLSPAAPTGLTAEAR